MGHTTSSLCNQEAFIVDLESAKGGERIAAVALTKQNVGSIDSTLFTKFYTARCEDSVNHWFKTDPGRSTMPPLPKPERVFKEFIIDPMTSTVAHPIPVVFLRLRGTLIQRHRHSPPTLDEIIQSSHTDVVGYFSCAPNLRSNDRTMHHIALFLTKVFQNEAKSNAIVEMACKCFQYFTARDVLGVDDHDAKIPDHCWPQRVSFTTQDTNLPLLRLIQKLLNSLPSDVSDSAISVLSTSINGGRCTFTIENQSVVADLGRHYASQVRHEDSINILCTRPAHNLSKIESACSWLDELIVNAKGKWKESNRPVAESTRPQLIVSSKKEVRPTRNRNRRGESATNSTCVSVRGDVSDDEDADFDRFSIHSATHSERRNDSAAVNAGDDESSGDDKQRDSPTSKDSNSSSSTSLGGQQSIDASPSEASVSRPSSVVGTPKTGGGLTAPGSIYSCLCSASQPQSPPKYPSSWHEALHSATSTTATGAVIVGPPRNATSPLLDQSTATSYLSRQWKETRTT